MLIFFLAARYEFFLANHCRDKTSLSKMAFATISLFIFMSTATLSVDLDKSSDERADSANGRDPGGEIPEIKHELHYLSIIAAARRGRRPVRRFV